MTEISLYSLTNTPVEKALPKLLEKVLASNMKAFVLTNSIERVKALDGSLWTYSPGAFLPHGTSQDQDPIKHPILLSCEQNNLNEAEVLVLLDGMMVPSIEKYKKCLELFDSKDPKALDDAKKRWNFCNGVEEHSVTYWQQTLQGQWENKQFFF